MKKVFYILFLILIIIIALQTMYIFNLHKDIESLTAINTVATDNSISNSTDISTNSSNTKQPYTQNSYNVTYVTNTEDTNITNTTNTLPDEPTEKYYPEKVQITIKNKTATKNGATIVIRDMNSENSAWEVSYSLHQKHDNFWVAVTPLKEPVFTEVALLCEDNILEQEINWKDLYGTLPNGTYRIVKTRYINGEYVQFTSNEFTLSSSKK